MFHVKHEQVETFCFTVLDARARAGLLPRLHRRTLVAMKRRRVCIDLDDGMGALYHEWASVMEAEVPGSTWDRASMVRHLVALGEQVWRRARGRPRPTTADENRAAHEFVARALSRDPPDEVDESALGQTPYPDPERFRAPDARELAAVAPLRLARSGAIARATEWPPDPQTPKAP